MKKIVYRLNGVVTLMHPAECFRLLGESDDDFLARVIAQDVPADAMNVTIIDTAVPMDRAARDAWKMDVMREAGSKVHGT